MQKNKVYYTTILALALVRPTPNVAQNLSHNNYQNVQINANAISYSVKMDDRSEYYPNFKFYTIPLGKGFPEGTTKEGNSVLSWGYLLVKHDNDYYVFYIKENGTIGASKVNTRTSEITLDGLAYEKYIITISALGQEELNKMMGNGKLHAIEKELNKSVLLHAAPLRQ